MRNKVIAFIAAIGISFAVATPASAQFLGPYYGGWGYGGYGYGYGWGYGGYGYGAAALGAGLAVGAIAGAIAASNQPYYYDGYYAAPQVVQKKQIIIRNSPGARVIEQDIFDW